MQLGSFSCVAVPICNYQIFFYCFVNTFYVLFLASFAEIIKGCKIYAKMFTFDSAKLNIKSICVLSLYSNNVFLLSSLIRTDYYQDNHFTQRGLMHLVDFPPFFLHLFKLAGSV